MFNMFGGKAAKEGVVATTAVKGNRKATMNDTTGQIIDLAEEKIYDLDMKKKTYEVTTFDELRQRMREAREKAEKDAAEEQAKRRSSEKTGSRRRNSRSISTSRKPARRSRSPGYDTHEVIMTITVREKGKTLEDGGGLVMTTDSWLGPQIPALKELAEFDMKYWKQLQGPDAMGMSAEQMATVIAMYPAVQAGDGSSQKEVAKLQGTPLATTTTVRRREVEGADGRSRAESGKPAAALERHARAQDGEERRHANAQRDDLHRGARDCRKFRRR